MAIQTLNITKSGNGTGTVTSDVGVPPVDCGTTCSVFETSGSNVTLTATPDPGSVFVKWTGDIPTTTVNPVTYTQALNPTNINAEFVKKKKGVRVGSLPPFICVSSSQFNTQPNAIRFRGVIYYFYKTDGSNYCFSKDTPSIQRNLVGLGGIFVDYKK